MKAHRRQGPYRTAATATLCDPGDFLTRIAEALTASRNLVTDEDAPVRLLDVVEAQDACLGD